MEKLQNITLINDDCLNYMRTLPDKAYDLCIADPAYGNFQSERNGFGVNSVSNTIKRDKVAWDKIYLSYPHYLYLK